MKLVSSNTTLPLWQRSCICGQRQTTTKIIYHIKIGVPSLHWWLVVLKHLLSLIQILRALAGHAAVHGGTTLVLVSFETSYGLNSKENFDLFQVPSLCRALFYIVKHTESHRDWDLYTTRLYFFISTFFSSFLYLLLSLLPFLPPFFFLKNHSFFLQRIPFKRTKKSSQND